MKQNRNKETALTDWLDEIKKSWTWERLTEQERTRFERAITSPLYAKSITGTYSQRWDLLNRFYSLYLDGLGYDDADWRGNKKEAKVQ